MTVEANIAAGVDLDEELCRVGGTITAFGRKFIVVGDDPRQCPPNGHFFRLGHVTPADIHAALNTHKRRNP